MHVELEKEFYNVHVGYDYLADFILYLESQNIEFKLQGMNFVTKTVSYSVLIDKELLALVNLKFRICGSIKL